MIKRDRDRCVECIDYHVQQLNSPTRHAGHSMWTSLSIQSTALVATDNLTLDDREKIHKHAETTQNLSLHLDVAPQLIKPLIHGSQVILQQWNT